MKTDDMPFSIYTRKHRQNRDEMCIWCGLIVFSLHFKLFYLAAGFLHCLHTPEPLTFLDSRV